MMVVMEAILVILMSPSFEHLVCPMPHTNFHFNTRMSRKSISQHGPHGLDVALSTLVKIIRTFKFEPRHEISNNVVCATSKASDQPAHTRSLIRAFASRLNILW